TPKAPKATAKPTAKAKAVETVPRTEGMGPEAPILGRYSYKHGKAISDDLTKHRYNTYTHREPDGFEVDRVTLTKALQSFESRKRPDESGGRETSPDQRVAPSSAAKSAPTPKSFESRRGKLSEPIKGGRVIKRFGTNTQEGIPMRGDYIKAKQGSPVSATADGTVVYADWMRGYGNIVVVDHGGGYQSVYAGVGDFKKSVGDTVAQGDVIASVGEPYGSYSNEPGILFSIHSPQKQANGRLLTPLNPDEWVSGRTAIKTRVVTPRSRGIEVARNMALPRKATAQ
ncbi:MAG: murein hydrolase activator EnvC family protein, partial [Duodenibacillus sp.]